MIGTGLFFLLIFLSGHWLSKIGKPYRSFPFNIHKLIGLAAGTFLIVTFVRRNQTAPIDSLSLASITFTVLLVILTVAAGGILAMSDHGRLSSLNLPIRAAVPLMHIIFPYPAVFSAIATLTLLLVSSRVDGGGGAEAGRSRIFTFRGCKKLTSAPGESKLRWTLMYN